MLAGRLGAGRTTDKRHKARQKRKKETGKGWGEGEGTAKEGKRGKGEDAMEGTGMGRAMVGSGGGRRL